MFGLPPIPRWDAAHPIVVHMPLGLLFFAPVLVVLAMVMKRRSAGLLIGAWATVVAGTVSLLLALWTGEAAEDVADGVPGAAAVLERHEGLAHAARNVFVMLAVLLTAWTVASLRYVDRWPRRAFVTGCAAYLLLHGAGALIMANAAHEGGRLVHEFGVRASMASNVPGTGRSVTGSLTHNDD
ncbi:MAG: DUF2231 domain-containing protein [Phycisphaeraceae bacterium]|nr:DUF2231 domain-containing protein [Phycisphaerae bacterium]MBX3392042.1 DUF2231 domain-containing protein [Phycisphaeraceae bacterium]HRJ49819.1 hypothetical protein [Phycisphaerales bacterium]